MKEITIVYASDENFLLQTYVSIYSVLKERETQYYINFVVLVPSGTRQQNYHAKWSFDNFSIAFEEINNNMFGDLEMKIAHITKPTYYRLLIPEILEKLDKCIYLDGDTVCCSDILELYEEQVDDYYIGGCMGELLNWNVDFANDIAARLDVPSGEGYINAGVLLMNLNKLREISRQLKSESHNNYQSQDQDVINKCCYGKIKILHPKYNLYSWTENMFKKNMVFRYSRRNMEEAMNNPYIIHYANEYTKPWRNNKCILYDLWWELAEQALPCEAVFELRQLTLNNMNEYSDDILFDKVKSAKKIVIFGFSKVGFEFEEMVIEKFGKEKILCFCDNDENKIGKIKDGLNVYPINAVRKDLVDNLIVITSQRYGKEIKRQLFEMGIKGEQFAEYRKKRDSYYISLREVDEIHKII